MSEQFPGEDPEVSEETEDMDSVPEPKTTMPPNYGALLRTAIDGFHDGEGDKPRIKSTKGRMQESPTLMPTTEDLKEVTRRQVMDDAKRAEEAREAEAGNSIDRKKRVIIPLKDLLEKHDDRNE